MPRAGGTNEPINPSSFLGAGVALRHGPTAAFNHFFPAPTGGEGFIAPAGLFAWLLDFASSQIALGAVGLLAWLLD